MKSLSRIAAALIVLSPLAAVADQDLPTAHNEATIAQLQAEMASGRTTSEKLTQEYLTRILALDQNGPGLNSIITLNPNALAIARQMDDLRKHGHLLGPMHGIPILLKDNIDTTDMQTTAGSHILEGFTVALANIDRMIEVIRTSQTPQIARERLLEERWEAGPVRAMLTASSDGASRPEELAPEFGLFEDGYRLSETQAKEILDSEISDEELAAQAEAAELDEEVSDDEPRT